MYRLIIVDNERAIADTVKEMFLIQTELELEVDVAYSAKEALEKHKALPADIMLCDISMPDISGIELAEMIMKRSPCTKIIFLTAYDTFDYAKTAIGLNVVDYVLKYEGNDRIIEVVKKAIDHLKRELSIQSIVQNMKDRMNTITELCIREFFSVQLSGSGHPQEELVNFFREMKLDYSYSRPVRLIVSNSNSEIPAHEFIVAGCEIVKKHCGAALREICGTRIFGYYVWIIDCVENDDEMLKEACKLISRSVEEDYFVELSFVVSGHAEQWQLISQKFDELCFLIGREMPGEILIEDATPQDSNISVEYNEFDYIAVKSVVETFKYSIDEFNESRAVRKLNEMRNYFEGVSIHYMPAVEVYLSICHAVLSFINRFELAQTLPFHTGIGEMLDRENFDNWSLVFDRVNSVIVAMFECHKYNQNNRVEDIIVKMKHYVAENIKTASLFEVAALLRVNSSYLSRIFKANEGLGFQEYVTMHRLEIARELLLTTDKKIFEIATQTGYDTNAYFSKVFKKVYGMNPNEYRELYSVHK